MKKNEKKTVLAKALTSVADGMLSKAANRITENGH